MNCCICGPAKNCAPYLPKVFANIERIGALFDDYKIVIYYDISTDNTLAILKAYQRRNPKLIFYVNKHPPSQFRTHNIAAARNHCLKYTRENKDNFPYFIMMDFDDVNCKEINTEPLALSLQRDDWDGLSFNTTPAYYDIWGISIWPFCFSYNHFENSVQYYTIIQNYITKKLSALPPGQLLNCVSAFNGLSIYRTSKFLDTYYDGRVRLDIFPKEYIQSHAQAQRSGIVYKDYGHVKGQYEDCEHRAFHQIARQNSGARIMISPEVLFM